jgi:hypothetical protein
LLDLLLVLQHRAEHLFEARLALLGAGKEWSTLGHVWKEERAASTHVSIMFITFGFHFFLHAARGLSAGQYQSC